MLVIKVLKCKGLVKMGYFAKWWVAGSFKLIRARVEFLSSEFEHAYDIMIDM